MSVAAGGTAVARFLSTHIDFGASNIPLYLSDGTFGAPALAFNNDTNTGVYRNAADDMVFVAGGNTVARGYLSGGSVPAWQVPDGAVANPGLQFNADPDTGFYRIGSGNIGFSADNSLVFQTLAYASGGAKVADYGGTAQIVGYRQVPRSTTATTLAKNDVAMCVAISAAINIPASVFSAGDAITIYNDSAGALNITISAGTLRLAGSASTGTRSLAARGLATLWFNVGGATPEVICSGSVT